MEEYELKRGKIMTFKSALEERIYSRAGGGEKGKKAVLDYREYIKRYNDFMRHELKEAMAQRFMPRREKTKGTSSIVYDEYE